MALNKVFLNKVSVKSIYDRYTYTTGDTLAECLTTGYFSGAPFDLTSPTNPIIEIDARDGDTITAIRLSDYVAIGVPQNDVAATVQTLADAVAYAESGLSVNGVVTTLEYNSGTGIGGNTYQKLDAGSSGARPDEATNFIIHIGSAGLYFKNVNVLDAESETTTVPAVKIIKDAYMRLDAVGGTTTVVYEPNQPLNIKNSEMHGGVVESGGSANYIAHLLNLAPTVDGDITIESSTISGWTYPILKANAGAGAQKNIKVINNLFDSNFSVDALFNSPAVGSSIKDVLVSGNTFKDNKGASIGGYSHRCSTAGNVEGFRILGNHATGSGNELWRAEENAKLGVVSCNTGHLEDRHGFEVADNNIGGTYATPSLLAITNNALKGSRVAGMNGIHCVHDGSGVHSLERSLVAGNVLSNWDSGLRFATKPQFNSAPYNVVNDSVNAIKTQQPSLLIDNTLVLDCDSAINSGGGGLFGRLDLRDTTTELPVFTALATSAGNPVAITGWTWESDLFSVPAVASYHIPIIQAGVAFDLDLVVYFGRDAATSFYSFVRGNVKWDGTTLTYTLSSKKTLGAVLLSTGAPFRVNAGNLEVQIFSSNVVVHSNCRMQIKASGFHVL